MNGIAAPRAHDGLRSPAGVRPALAALAGGAAALACWSAAAAQTGGIPLAPGAGSLIIDQQRQDRQVPAAPSPSAAPRLAPTTETPPQIAPTTRLHEIRLAGTDRLGPRLAAITARFAGRPLDAATIRGAADAVSQAYAGTGLALYTVAVPRQDLSRGVLTLLVVEGYIGEVTVDGDKAVAHDALIGAYTTKLKAQRPLMRATLERYLSLMRDIPGATVEAKLFNTPAPGAVRLALTIRRKRVQPDLAFNNNGTPRLGAVQALGSLAVNGLLRSGDQARLTASVPTDLQRFQYLGLGYATPIGADGVSVRGDLSYLRTRPELPPIDGTAVSAGVQIAYPLIRGYTRNLTISGGLDGLNSDNALYGLALTSDHTRAVRAGLVYSRIAPKRTVSASAIASLGVDILGARADTRLSDADFRKLDLQVGVDQMVGSSFALRLRGLAQTSRGRLPTAEQLPLGGETYGRAFFPATVLGDYGYAGSVELAFIAPKPWPAPLKGSEIFGFVDQGRAWSRDRLPYVAAQRYELASAGVGLRLLIHQKTMIGLEAAKAIDAPLPGEDRPWRLIVSWRITR